MITYETVVFEAQLYIFFYFVEKSCSVLEVFIFFYIFHYINVESSDVMISIELEFIRYFMSRILFVIEAWLTARYSHE